MAIKYFVATVKNFVPRLFIDIKQACIKPAFDKHVSMVTFKRISVGERSSSFIILYSTFVIP